MVMCVCARVCVCGLFGLDKVSNLYRNTKGICYVDPFIHHIGATAHNAQHDDVALFGYQM